MFEMQGTGHSLFKAILERHKGRNNKGSHSQIPTVSWKPNEEEITETFLPSAEEGTNYLGDGDRTLDFLA
jgi:hypothetical protein